MSLINQAEFREPQLPTEESATSDKRDGLTKELRKAQRAIRKAERAEKLASRTPEEQKRHAAKLARRAELRLLTKAERQAMRQADRVAKLESLSPEKRVKREAKLARRAAIRENRKAHPEQYAAERAIRKAAAATRKLEYAKLTASWCDQVPTDCAHLIVDGNNMRGGGPRHISREAVIEEIRAVLGALPLWEQTRALCVFDGHPYKGVPTDTIQIETSGDQIADDLIVSKVAELPDREHVLVVTCDRGLAIRVLALGAKVMRNGTFRRLNSSEITCSRDSH